MNEAYGKDGVKQLKKDYADLKKNPPKIEKEENYFVVKIYSNTTKGYIGVAEYTKQAVARADLKHFMKDHKETLAKIDKLSKDVVKESENMDDDFNTLSKRIADLGEVGDTIFYNDLNIPDQMLRNSDAFAFGGRNGLGIGFESIEEAELDEGLRLPPEIAKKLSAMVAGGAKGKIIPFQSRFGNDKSTFGYTDAKGNKHDVIVTNGKLSRKETAAIIQGIRDKFEVKESLDEAYKIGDKVIVGDPDSKYYKKRATVYNVFKATKTKQAGMTVKVGKDVFSLSVDEILGEEVLEEKVKKFKVGDHVYPDNVGTSFPKGVHTGKIIKKYDAQLGSDKSNMVTLYKIKWDDKKFKPSSDAFQGNGLSYAKDIGKTGYTEGFGADTQKKKETASDKAWKELQKKHSGNKKLLDKASEYYAKNYTPKAAFAKAMTNEDTINVVELFKENKSFHRHEKQVLIDTLKGLLGDKVTMDFGNPEKMTATYKGKVVDVTKAGKQYVATYGNKIVTSSSIDGAVLKHPKITIFEEVIEEKMSLAVRNAFDEIDYQYTDLGTSEAYFKVNKEEMDEFLKKLGKRQKKKGDTYFKGKYDVVYDEDKGAATFKIKTASKNQNIYGE